MMKIERDKDGVYYVDHQRFKIMRVGRKWNVYDAGKITDLQARHGVSAPLVFKTASLADVFEMIQELFDKEKPRRTEGS